MTDLSSVEASEQSSLFQLQLRSILLYDCKVVRGEAGVDPDPPGDVDAEVNLRTAQSDELLSYEVAGVYSFSNAKHQLIATVEMTFSAEYDKPTDVHFSENEIDEFAHSVIFQVTPFQREFLATVTNRMGITPFYMPLLRGADLRFQRPTDQDN